MKELKYNFYEFGRRVVCTTKLGGKKFRAVATCAPVDEYNFEIGKKLAKARVDEKVAFYRHKRVLERLHALKDLIEELQGDERKLIEKATRTFNEFDKTALALTQYENSLR